MAFYDIAWYANSVGYTAVTAWATGATIAAGVLRRQNTTPAVGNERVFVCIVAGTTNATTEPTWVLTRGAKTTDNTVTWQECTGASAVNGDLADTPNWTAAKAIGAPTLGAIIKRNSGASFQICTSAGSMGTAEPAFSDVAGATTTESPGTTIWTSLGPVGNFTGGQAPHARLASACALTWFAAGNTVYVGDNHAESQATAITITPALTIATMGRIICHNHSGSYPPAASDLRTTATVSTTANVAVSFNPNSGAIYVYGISFIAGVGASTAGSSVFLTPAGAWYFFDNCLFKIAGTAASANVIQINGNSAGVVIWNNCQVSFAAVQNLIEIGVTINFTWQNTGPVLASGSSVPSNLFGVFTAGRLSSVILEAIDLSQISTGLYSYAVTLAIGNFLIKDCKLNASLAIPSPQAYGQTFQIVRSDSGATGYKSARYQYEGTETTETSITRVGGAADPTGQAQSRKIVTTANVQWLRPFKAEPYAIWNPVTGANVTVTVCGTVNSGTLPNNDDLWLECEYISDTASPLGKIVTTTKASLLASNAAVSSDGSTWNGGGSGAGWSPFKLAVTLSSPQPGLAGYIHARVRAAKPGTTWYIDPRITLT